MGSGGRGVDGRLRGVLRGVKEGRSMRGIMMEGNLSS
jgi:hypothetical protein